MALTLAVVLEISQLAAALVLPHLSLLGGPNCHQSLNCLSRDNNKNIPNIKSATDALSVAEELVFFADFHAAFFSHSRPVKA